MQASAFRQCGLVSQTGRQYDGLLPQIISHMLAGLFSRTMELCECGRSVRYHDGLSVEMVSQALLLSVRRIFRHPFCASSRR